MLYAICYVNSLKVLIPITLHAEFLDLSNFLTRLGIFLSPKVLNQSIHQLLTSKKWETRNHFNPPMGSKWVKPLHLPTTGTCWGPNKFRHSFD